MNPVIVVIFVEYQFAYPIIKNQEGETLMNEKINRI